MQQQPQPPRPRSPQQHPQRPQPAQQLPQSTEEYTRSMQQPQPPRLRSTQQHPRRPQPAQPLPQSSEEYTRSTQQQPQQPPRPRSTQQHHQRPQPAQQLPQSTEEYPRSTQQQPQQPPRPRSTQQHPQRPQPVQQLPQPSQQRPQSTEEYNTQSAATRPNRSPSVRSSRPLPVAPAHSPEPIDIRRDSRPPSPTRSLHSHRSRRSVALPPDGIPTLGADSVISLPAPYELSRPVSVMDTPATERGGIDLGSGRRRTRTMSNVSAVSTRLSQFDILCPPQAAEAPVSLSDQVAREWRVANPDSASRQGTTEESHSSENFSIRSSAPRSQASLRSAPRRPREIVMPMPLSTAMHAGGGVSYTQPIANSSAAPPPIRDPYSAPSGSSSVPITTAPPPPHGPTGDITLSRPRSAMAWIKSRFNRTTSSYSVPNIEIEPPSNPTSGTSTDCTVNAILLTPEHAGTSTLPHHFIPELAGALAGVQLENENGAGTGNLIVLPDNELPRGFVPLSPILPDLHTIPGPAPVPVPVPGVESSTSAPPAARASPQPPAYTPHDIYAVRELPRPATAAPRTRSPPRFEVESVCAGSSTRARGASIGSAMLASPPALARPISLFSSV
ncbi:hypothetical protein C8R45DRAFT_83689 [Mycena sanguinolenta]|nr:hypothetical protein C8R45DRAFT_83689 [Mycena sanguinolenta]